MHSDSKHYLEKESSVLPQIRSDSIKCTEHLLSKSVSSKYPISFTGAQNVLKLLLNIY